MNPVERVKFNEDGQTFAVDSDGGNEELLLDSSSGEVSPDGRWVIDIQGLGASMWIAPTVPGEAVKVIDAPAGTDILGAAWSPDSGRIAFEAHTFEDQHLPTTSDIWVVDVDGSNLVQLTDTAVEHEYWPVWTRDGRHIAFAHDPDANSGPGGNGIGLIDVAAATYEVTPIPPGLLFRLSNSGFASGEDHLIVAGRPYSDPDVWDTGPGDLWRFDVVSGDATMVLGANSSKSLSLMDVSADGETLLYRTVSWDGSRVWQATTTGSGKTLVFHETGAGVFDARLNARGDLVAVNSFADGQEHIEIVDLATGGVSTIRSAPSLGVVRWIPPGNLCNGLVATVSGTDASETLVGTGGNDVIVGFGGDDVIEGRGGSDVICAGYGNDTIRGEAGDDAIHAGPGKDEVRGGAGNDTLFGDLGNDMIFGGEGTDVIRGGPGADMIHGQGWKDRLYGDLGVDEIDGGRGDDRIWGGKADDTVRGWLGDDTIFGGGGDDTLHGGPDTDTVNGNNGNDTCTGETVLNC